MELSVDRSVFKLGDALWASLSLFSDFVGLGDDGHGSVKARELRLEACQLSGKTVPGGLIG